MRIPGRPGRRRGGPSPPKGDLRVVHAIVGSFLGDDDVVDMAFAQARGGDFHHLGFFEEFLNGRRAAVAHTGADAAHKLVNGLAGQAAEGHASHDAFGDELLALLLEVTVGAAFLHGVDGPHAAIDLVGTALIEDGFARAFLGAREQAADHDGIRSGGEGRRI